MSKTQKVKEVYVETAVEGQTDILPVFPVGIITLSHVQQEVYGTLKTKSAQIRYLNSEGFTRSQIAKYLDIRYQHVRNVLTTELKRVVSAA